MYSKYYRQLIRLAAHLVVLAGTLRTPGEGEEPYMVNRVLNDIKEIINKKEVTK